MPRATACICSKIAPVRHASARMPLHRETRPAIPQVRWTSGNGEFSQFGNESRLQRSPWNGTEENSRPETRILKLDATPEYVAKAMFAAAKPPDSSKRITPKK